MVAIIRLFARASVVAAAFGLLVAPAACSAAPSDHREGSLLVRLGRRSADLAGRLAGRVRAGQRRREEGRLRHRHLARQVRRQRAAARAHERHPRHQPALVADGRRLAFVRVRGEGRTGAAAADLCHGDGRRRAVGDHRYSARRRQPGVGARRPHDCLLVDGARDGTDRGAKPAGDKPRETDVRVITEAVYRANGVPADRLRRSRSAVAHLDRRRAGERRATKTTPIALTSGEFARQQSPVVAPTARASSSSSDRRRESYYFAARQRPLLGSEGRRRADARVVSIDGPHRRLRLSPDGKRVAFVGIADGAAGTRRTRSRISGSPSSAPARRAISRRATTSTSAAGSAATSARRAAAMPGGPIWSRDGRAHPDRRRRAGQRQPEARSTSRPAKSTPLTSGNRDVMGYTADAAAQKIAFVLIDANRRRRSARDRRRVAGAAQETHDVQRRALRPADDDRARGDLVHELRRQEDSGLDPQAAGLRRRRRSTR